ncbi:MAG TPA: hypothetical protein VFI23_17475 [Rhizomicrobium sp.]|nr:hypothetical protein [Rhizomicrobium sp.]
MQRARHITIAWILLLAACSPAKNPAVEALNGLSVEQKRVLTAWLSKNDSLRLSKDQDCNCKNEIDEIRRNGPWGKPIPGYQPYLQIGDFNHDTYSDFAITLVRKRDPARRTLVIFNGGAAHQLSDPAFVMDANPPAALFYDQKHALSVGAPFSDNFCELKPIGPTYKPDCESGDYG